MQSVGRPGGGRSGARALGALIAMALLPICVIAAAPAGAQDEPISETITVTGRGWGHGRGLGQWGAFGYATGRSGGPWTYRTILDHYYRDTDLSSIANPLAAVTLLEQRGRPLMVERAAGVTIDGLDDPSDPDLLDEVSTAVRVTMRPDGRYEVERSTSCTDGVWSPPVVVNHPVRLRAAGTTGERDDVLRLCHDDGTSTGYRGELVAMSRTFDGRDVGLAQTVNLVRLDDLLRSVLPGQLPPSWASVDEGRGRSALLAQAVAARGFAAYGDGRWHDLHTGLGATFSTCDSNSCQRYAGVEVEDSITDAVVRETSGEVRVRGAELVRTEFHASSGGWTAGGTFPAVIDVGDAVPANPHRRWTTLIDRSAIEGRYELGRLQAITVLERNGLGDDGGRVLKVRLVGTAASVDLTGQELRSAFGLRSDWFTLSGAPPRPPVTPRGIDLACPDAEADAGDVFDDVGEDNVHRAAIACALDWQVTSGIDDDTYGPAGRVTRAQMASFVARFLEAAGGNLPQGDDYFEDDDGLVHEDAINSLAALGIVQGVGSARFDPKSDVDRAQTAALLARTFEHIGVQLPPNPGDAFADDTGSTHEPAINAVAAEGIVTGVSAGRLDPSASTRRDQMASLLARALDLLVERLGIAPPPEDP